MSLTILTRRDKDSVSKVWGQVKVYEYLVQTKFICSVDHLNWICRIFLVDILFVYE